MSIQRYAFFPDEDHECRCELKPVEIGGAWCKYADHAAEVARLTRIIDNLDGQCDKLLDTCDQKDEDYARLREQVRSLEAIIAKGDKS